jgi:transposase-like protein
MLVLPCRVHLGVVLCFVILVLLGHSPISAVGGLPLCGAGYGGSAGRGRGAWGGHGSWCDGGQGWRYLCGTWQAPLARSMLLAGLWLASDRAGAWVVIACPWVVWAWQGVGVFCPTLARQPEWLLLRGMLRLTERILLASYMGLALGNRLTELGWSREGGESAGLVGISGIGALVQVHHAKERGCYRAELRGDLTLEVADDDPFRLRLLILFLRLLEDSQEQRGSRRTREGRTPYVRQQYLARVLGITQPEISRWERYWQQGDWRRLLSQKNVEVLTLELQQRIIESWAHWPSWGVQEVHRFLREQQVAVGQDQVRQAAEESGWGIVRQVLGRLCVQRGEELRLRENWLVGELLAQIEVLLGKVEKGERLTTEEQLDVRAWQEAAGEAGLQARATPTGVPWLRGLKQVLFAPSLEVPAAGVCCPTCGSSHVGRKGLKGRPKRFVDAQGQQQVMEVYRYRCHNPACSRKSFTLFPPGLLPYSPWKAEVHLLALQMYAWGYSTYRRTAAALGVTGMTAYRWVSAFGEQLLPVAALFGVLRSSGVVGVDEKWVQVPKNNKSAGPNRKWMYVYLAVDAYTYDLLHIAIYPHNTLQSAHAFLLALRAKGDHPQVVITDLRQDYGPAIAQVFPQAQHHECLFHALQALHHHLADIYGWEALHHDQTVIALRQTFDAPLTAHTSPTAQQRYDALMTRRDAWLHDKPELDALFVFLETHWPRLLNGIDSDLIPRTNNTVELVIRRFDQHYQNFCAFDSLRTAASYLAVFEMLYRCTPFSADAQPRIRGRSPLQLAGYDVGNMPITAACTGLAIHLPAHLSMEAVPNV